MKRIALFAALAVGVAAAMLTVHSVAWAQLAPARTASPSRDAVSATASGPSLTLIGKLTKVVPVSKIPAVVTWDGTKAGNINPVLRAVYKGQTMYKLIGLVDDKDPGSFNKARAEKGYKIKLFGLDGYTWTITSKSIIGAKHRIVAKLKNGKALPAGESPLRYVGPFIKPFNGKASVYKLYKIKLIF
jgi:hypothetical protein